MFKEKIFWDSCWHLLGLLSLVHDDFMKTKGIFPHNVEETSYYGHSLPGVLLVHQNCLLTWKEEGEQMQKEFAKHRACKKFQCFILTALSGKSIPWLLEKMQWGEVLLRFSCLLCFFMKFRSARRWPFSSPCLCLSPTLLRTMGQSAVFQKDLDTWTNSELCCRRDIIMHNPYN